MKSVRRTTVLIAVVMSYSTGQSGAQEQSVYYQRAIEWIRENRSLKSIVSEHVFERQLLPGGPLSMAISDTLDPIIYVAPQFDDSCRVIRDRSAQLEQFLFESKYVEGRFQYLPALEGLWNESDSLVVVFGYVFRNTLRAEMLFREPTHQRTMKGVVPEPSPITAWRPRGRPVELGGPFVSISFCFNSKAEICNAIVEKWFH